jgi:glycosyltransferase involved in cell wall biosynthesis
MLYRIVVGGDSPGVAAVVANGRSGLLAPPGDVPAFAAAVKRLLHDDALRSRLADDATAYVRERHDVRRAARDLDQLLHGVTRRRPAVTASSTC